MNRLSHSSVTRFQQCPKSFEFHYRHRLRSKISSAALLFGSAVDGALQVLLQTKDLAASEQEFAVKWTHSEINGREVHVPSCAEIAYSKNDADMDLLSADGCTALTIAHGDDWRAKLSVVLDKQKNRVAFKYLKREEKLLLNLYSWHCLHTKGRLMLQQVAKSILPLITEVLSVQEKVELTNDGGDSVIGYVDLVCRMVGYDKPVIIDFKTSSIEYDEDVVLTSPQLTLYMHALSEKYESTRNAGFVVLHKNVKKNRTKVCKMCGFDGTGTRYQTCNNTLPSDARCAGEWIEVLHPEIRTQILIDSIPEQTEDIVMSNIDDINKAIKTEVFTRNLGSCVMAWGRCSFYNKCYKGDDSDLIVAPEREQK